MWILASQVGVIRRNVKLHAGYVAVNLLWAASAVPMAAFNALRVNLKAHNDLASILAGSSRRFPPSDDQGMVVVDEISWFSGDGGIILVSHFEACCVILVGLIDRHKTCSARKVVHNPIDYISIFHQLLRPLDPSPINLATAKILTFIVLSHKEVVVRSHDPISPKHLSQVKGDASATGITGMLLSCRRADEWKVIIREL